MVAETGYSAAVKECPAFLYLIVCLCEDSALIPEIKTITSAVFCHKCICSDTKVRSV